MYCVVSLDPRLIDTSQPQNCKFSFVAPRMVRAYKTVNAHFAEISLKTHPQPVFVTLNLEKNALFYAKSTLAGLIGICSNEKKLSTCFLNYSGTDSFASISLLDASGGHLPAADIDWGKANVVVLRFS